MYWTPTPCTPKEFDAHAVHAHAVHAHTVHAHTVHALAAAKHVNPVHEHEVYFKKMLLWVSFLLYLSIASSS